MQCKLIDDFFLASDEEICVAAQYLKENDQAIYVRKPWPLSTVQRLKLLYEFLDLVQTKIARINDPSRKPKKFKPSAPEVSAEKVSCAEDPK